MAPGCTGGGAVVELARVEGLDAHKRAMEIRMEALGMVEKKVLEKEKIGEAEVVQTAVVGEAMQVEEGAEKSETNGTAVESSESAKAIETRPGEAVQAVQELSQGVGDHAVAGGLAEEKAAFQEEVEQKTES